ncbi:MAG TPA: hypothetical protein PK495_04630 [Bacteroidales bacterium]|nr:hypothetical protein [Bacteroidales bacterium]
MYIFAKRNNKKNALKTNNMNFAIKEGGFGSKQFWLDTKGIDWWESTSFSGNFTGTVNIKVLKIR